ncbi:MAG: hypothetical protein OXH52_07900 [Gammaproteobacteria bacterium]|nr:hypothetical protein [Gammaproteobacteria bacterium]
MRPSIPWVLPDEGHQAQIEDALAVVTDFPDEMQRRYDELAEGS